MASILDKLKHGWNAFNDNQNIEYVNRTVDYGNSYGSRPDRRRGSSGNERSIVSAILTHIAMDVATINIKHVRLDENDRFVEGINSGLNNCLTIEANIDQAARHFRQDLVMSMFEQGVIAVVPIDTTLNPIQTGGYDINTMRIGEIVSWHPRHVKVRVYDDRPGQGKKHELLLPKDMVAIIENPLYAIMNEPNSTLQRLIRKLNLLDAVDEASGSGKLDLLIQLPYALKSDARKQQAEQRQADIQNQLKGSAYGIAYLDATEKVTQLNRPAENNMLAQIQYLTTMLYGQLGLTETVFNGTADEATMLNYHNRTVEPILGAVSEAFKRSFLTKTARTQRQSIEYYRDPFKLVSVKDLAEIADKFTRNAIFSSNEVRGLVGFKPSADPAADELRNKNIPEPIPPGDSPQPVTPDPLAQPTASSLPIPPTPEDPVLVIEV
jgi:hypothetical protein